MTIRLSTGFRNHMLNHGSIKRSLQGGKLYLYSGSQPSSADSAPTGTLLAIITKSSGAHTPEVLATGSITLTGTTGGVSTVTVDGVNLIPDGAVAFNTSLAQTAADLATAINKAMTSPDYSAAVASGSTVTITAMRGSGAGANGLAVSGTYSGDMGGTYANMASGVTAANGLQFDIPASGTMAKDTAQTWTGIAVASGTAGWGRFIGSVADSGLADADGAEVRLDGSIATSGGDITMTNTSVVSGATQTVTDFSVTMPAA